MCACAAFHLLAALRPTDLSDALLLSTYAYCQQSRVSLPISLAVYNFFDEHLPLDAFRVLSAQSTYPVLQ